MTSRESLQRIAALSGLVAFILPSSIGLVSAARSPAANWLLRLALAGFCILAVAAPAGAVLVTIALVGFGIILSHLAGVPDLRVTEVLVVASIAGCCVRALVFDARLRQSLIGSLSPPLVLFGMTVAASALVWLRVQQFETDEAWPFLRLLFGFLAEDYFTKPAGFWSVVSAAVIIEGLALYVVCAALCRTDSTFFQRALRMLAVGGAGLAMMSVVRLGEMALRSPGVIQDLRSSGALRISPQIPDYIAAGSYFALCCLTAIGLAFTGPGRLMWLALAVPLIAALYLTGSRSVIAALVAGIAVFMLVVSRWSSGAIRKGLLFLALSAVLVVSYPLLTGRDVAGDLAKQSLAIRAELVRTGLRVIATRPLFGVGVDRFYLSAGNLASPQLNEWWPGRKNPHNDFLRFAGELGVIGLGLFLWILTAAAHRVWRALRRSGDRTLAGIVAGLIAFLVTSMVSNPLMVREVSYAFWIVLGLAVGRSVALRASDVPEPARAESPGPSRLPALRVALAVVLGGVIVLSVPFRANQELSHLDVTRISYGFYAWSKDADGTPRRWTGPKATFFVDGRARVVEIPLSGTQLAGSRQQVEVRLDGHVVERVIVGREWQRTRVVIPARPSMNSHRIELLVSPTWVPSEVISGNRDTRELGVKVGEIEVFTSDQPDGSTLETAPTDSAGRVSLR